MTFEVLERMALRLTLRLYGHLGRATQAAQYPRILEILREESRNGHRGERKDNTS